MNFKVVTKVGADMPAWYLALAYEVYDTNRAVWIMVPFHGFVKAGRFIMQLWNYYRKRPTWFDKQMQAMYQDGIKMGYLHRVKEVSKSQRELDDIRHKLKLVHKN